MSGGSPLSVSTSASASPTSAPLCFTASVSPPSGVTSSPLLLSTTCGSLRHLSEFWTSTVCCAGRSTRTVQYVVWSRVARHVAHYSTVSRKIRYEIYFG